MSIFDQETKTRNSHVNFLQLFPLTWRIIITLTFGLIFSVGVFAILIPVSLAILRGSHVAINWDNGVVVSQDPEIISKLDNIYKIVSNSIILEQNMLIDTQKQIEKLEQNYAEQMRENPTQANQGTKPMLENARIRMAEQRVTVSGNVAKLDFIVNDLMRCCR